MTAAAEDRVHAMLAEAASLLESGRGGEASDIFGRVLLLDPACLDARGGLEAARALLAEERRRLDGRIEEARTAIPEDPERARAILDQVLRDGGDRDRAHALLDRLDDRAGRLDAGPLPSNEDGEVGGLEPPRRRSPVSRQAFVAGCTVSFVALAVGLAFSWEQLVWTLVQNPAPQSLGIPPSTGVPEPAAGEAALARAREMMRQGDPARALAALDRVSPEDPSYPLARRLRAEAVAALGRAGTR